MKTFGWPLESLTTGPGEDDGAVMKVELIYPRKGPVREITISPAVCMTVAA